MKKFILVFSLFFGSSLLSANSLAVSDQQFLFGKTQNVKAQLISNNEMAQTDAQGWFSSVAIVTAFFAYSTMNPVSLSQFSYALSAAAAAEKITWLP